MGQRMHVQNVSTYDIIYKIKQTRPPPFVFVYCKLSMRYFTSPFPETSSSFCDKRGQVSMIQSCPMSAYCGALRLTEARIMVHHRTLTGTISCTIRETRSELLMHSTIQ